MDSYQQELFNLFAPFRLERNEAPYPPYHQGEYLEEYFVRNYLENNVQSERYFIPIHWTAVFNFRVKEGLQEGTANYSLRRELFNTLKTLDPNKTYFTVSTHDDAPQGEFPTNTLHFYAGGNSKLDNTFPLPVICSGFKEFNDSQKMIFCSFVGSITHPIRNIVLKEVHEKPGYFIQAFHWQQDIPDDRKIHFKNVLEQSRFTLCPRGYGATSYRMYEAIQVGSIPVYISDKFVFAWEDELDWSEFCVIVPESKITEIDSMLKEMSETQVRKMQERLKVVYDQYFTIPAAYNQIIKRVT